MSSSSPTTSSLCPNDSSRRGAVPRGEEPARLLPALIVFVSALLVWPASGLGSRAWGQVSPSTPAQGATSPAGGSGTPSQTQEGTPPAGETPVPTPESQGQAPLPPQPQQPFFVPQFPAQYPPAFQQPFGVPTIGPGDPGGGPLRSPWTPPVAPPPSQTRDPGALPPAAFQALGGGKLFNLRPTLSLSEQWTDNFRLSARDRQENFRTTLGPGLSLQI